MSQQKREGMQNPAPRKRTGFWFRFLTMAAIVFAVVCCLTLFFQVDEITVVGNHLYSEEQILDACGISKGDNLVSIQKANAASLIMSSLPFVETVHVERFLPDRVEITVTEADVTFAFRAQNETYYLMTTQGKILEAIQTANAADYPNVEGLTITEPTIGTTLYVSEEQTENRDAALELMQLLSDYGIAGAVRQIDVAKPYDLRIHYGNQFEVMLGGTDNLEYKVSYLVSVLDKLGEDEAGIIDLTFEEEKTARYQPY